MTRRGVVDEAGADDDRSSKGDTGSMSMMSRTACWLLDSCRSRWYVKLRRILSGSDCVRVFLLCDGRGSSVGKGRVIAGSERCVVFDPDLVIKGIHRRFWVDGSDIRDSMIRGRGRGGVWCCAVERWRSSVSAKLLIVSAAVSCSIICPVALTLFAMQLVDKHARDELE